MWQHWINFIIGILLLIFAYTGASATTLVVMGILLIVFSLWGAFAGSGSSARRTA